MMVSDTIAAIATALSNSGIGIVRISGENAIEVGDRIFCSPGGRKILKTAESHTIHYGYIMDNEEVVDEVMTSVMRAPRSFTAEDTVEIHCHGGVVVVKKILEIACKNGARLAEPGEFTKRAFLNGRIDLSKAEAVMDIIHSQNEYALKSSVRQLQGKLENQIRKLREDIIYEIAFIESALDDPEHISLDGYPEKLQQKVLAVKEKVKSLMDSFVNGKLMKEGISTVIVGKPNAGKSSLLNLLVGEDCAIVTDIAGTTRDVLQQSIHLHGIQLNLIDTAGIRNTEDVVEKIGVEKARKYAKEADLILYVVDTSEELDDSDREIISLLKGKKAIILLNKSDMESVVDEKNLVEEFKNAGIEIQFENRTDTGARVKQGFEDRTDTGARVKQGFEDRTDTDKKMEQEFEKNYRMIRTSAREETGIKELEEAVKEMFYSGIIKSNDEVVITNLRHREALQNSYESLELVLQSIENGMPEDFYSIDLMSAYRSLGLIIGEEVEDDLVEEIFSKFCMGK